MLIQKVVIAQTGTISGACPIREETRLGVLIPPLDSCTVFFLGSDEEGGTYTRLQKEDWSADLTTGTITTTGKAVVLNSPFPFKFLKIETSAAQTTAARTFTVCAKM